MLRRMKTRRRTKKKKKTMRKRKMKMGMGMETMMKMRIRMKREISSSNRMRRMMAVSSKVNNQQINYLSLDHYKHNSLNSLTFSPKSRASVLASTVSLTPSHPTEALPPTTDHPTTQFPFAPLLPKYLLYSLENSHEWS